MDETEAIEALTHEMDLTRMEMAALTDSLNRLHHSMTAATAETHRLAALIEDSRQRGFWQRHGATLRIHEAQSRALRTRQESGHTTVFRSHAPSP